MSDLLTHAAAYLESLNMIEPLLDRFMEECPELEKAAEEYFAFYRGTEFPSDGVLDNLISSTAHSATQRLPSPLAETYSPGSRPRHNLEDFAHVIMEGNYHVQAKPRLADRLPTYYGMPTLKGGLQWWVRRSVRVGPADGRHHWRRLRDRRIDSTQMVKELHAAGGMANVFHAVIGAHHFAVHTRNAELSAV